MALLCIVLAHLCIHSVAYRNACTLSTKYGMVPSFVARECSLISREKSTQINGNQLNLFGLSTCRWEQDYGNLETD